jgi:hypothetical protein
MAQPRHLISNIELSLRYQKALVLAQETENLKTYIPQIQNVIEKLRNPYYVAHSHEYDWIDNFSKV